MTTSLTPITLFKCLADDTRARLMLLINQEHELCVCELTCALDLSQPKISRHLAQLRQCGLLSDRRAGQWVYYQVDPQLPVWAREIIALATAAYGQALRDDETRLQGMNERPQRSSLCCHSGD